MQTIGKKIAFIGTVMQPEGTPFPHPRQYFDVGRQLSDKELQDLDALLPTVCKHISGVTACLRMPSGEPAHLYVTYGGFDPSARSTTERINRYQNDVMQALAEYFAGNRR